MITSESISHMNPDQRDRLRIALVELIGSQALEYESARLLDVILAGNPNEPSESIVAKVRAYRQHRVLVSQLHDIMDAMLSPTEKE